MLFTVPYVLDTKTSAFTVGDSDDEFPVNYEADYSSKGSYTAEGAGYYSRQLPQRALDATGSSRQEESSVADLFALTQRPSCSGTQTSHREAEASEPTTPPPSVQKKKKKMDNTRTCVPLSEIDQLKKRKLEIEIEEAELRCEKLRCEIQILRKHYE